MEEIDNVSVEKLNQKVKSKKRVRGLLIAINALLASYLIFEIVLKVMSNQKQSESNTVFISLNDESRNQSTKIYDKFILKDEAGNYQTTDAYDYGIYGHYLHLSNHSFQPGDYTSFENLNLINTKSKTLNLSTVSKSYNSDYLNTGIDLSKLEEGDYLLTEGAYAGTISPLKAVKIKSHEAIEETIYTLPDENGHRKKIVIKNLETSPSLVISVKDTIRLEKDYYDFTLVGSDEEVETFAKRLDSNSTYVKVSTLEKAYLANSTYCFVVEKDAATPIGSNYLDFEGVSKDELYGGDSIISKQDKNEYIRELGGHITGSGSALSEDEKTFATRPYISSSNKGKMTLVVSPYQVFEKTMIGLN